MIHKNIIRDQKNIFTTIIFFVFVSMLYLISVNQSVFDNMTVISSLQISPLDSRNFTPTVFDGENIGLKQYTWGVFINNPSNNPPIIGNVTIIPNPANVSNNLQFTFDYFDPDGDPGLDMEVLWYKNGMIIHELNNSLTAYSAFTSSGNNWFVRIRISDGQDWSSWVPSNIVKILPYTGITVPDPPDNLIALAGNNQIILHWEYPSYTGGIHFELHYNIYRSGSDNDFEWIASTSKLTYTDTSVQNDNTYFYVVTAINDIGESIYSNEASAIPSNSQSTSFSNRINITTPGFEIFWIFTLLFISRISYQRQNKKY